MPAMAPPERPVEVVWLLLFEDGSEELEVEAAAEGSRIGTRCWGTEESG